MEPREKFVKTAIYGAKLSGYLAERGIRQAAELQKDEYSRQYEIIQQDLYVDDFLSRENSKEEVNDTTNKLEIVVNKVNMYLKGISSSGATLKTLATRIKQ